MKHILITLLIVLSFAANTTAQLSVGSGGLTIKSGSVFSSQGLVLQPSTDVNMIDNSITFSGTAIVNGSNNSINRVYLFATPQSSYSGSIGIQYSAGELNGNNESDLQIAYNPLSSGGSYVVSSGSSTGSAGSYYVSNSLSGVNLGVVTALPASPPTVTTQTVITYDATSATMGGNVTSANGATVSERGVVYSSIDATPTIGEAGVTKDANGTGTGSFSKSISGLSGNTTYYVCAYATNSAGTNYGEVVSFTTLPDDMVITSSDFTSADDVAPFNKSYKSTSFTVTPVSHNYSSIEANSGFNGFYSYDYNSSGGNGTEFTISAPGYSFDLSSFKYYLESDRLPSLTITLTFVDGSTDVKTYTFTGASTGVYTFTNFTKTANDITSIKFVSSDYMTFNNFAIDDIKALPRVWNGSAWSPTAPTASDDAIINGDYSGAGFSCNNLTINAGKQVSISSGTLAVGGNLVLKSDANSTASLIGTTTVGGTSYAECYLTANKWHIVSPIAATQTVAAFLTANTIIPTKTGTPDKRGMMDYNTSTNSWNDYYPATGASGNMEAGKGYSARVASSGTLTFTGTLTSGDKTVALTKASDDNSWNCIGNPYTSAINLNATAHATNNFITQNAGILDASYACIYIWDEDATYTGQNCYKIISNSGFSLPGKTNISQNYVAPGQGFFVKARTNGTNITFTSAMQTHQPTAAFKSAKISWPGIELTASSGDIKASAVVTFNEMMTKGLDPTYDAGLLRSSNGLSVYTRLVDDNGVDFAIQCLPEKGMESYVIPIGLDSKAGGEIKFSAATVGLPTGSSVILEDRMAKIFTNLSNGGVYAVTVSANSNGTGRFYIHTSALTTGTSDLLPAETFSLKAYPTDGMILIEGQVSSSAKAHLFNVAGNKLGEFNLTEGNRNSIPASGMVTGVYLLKVTDGSKLFNTKIVIRQ